MRILSKRAIKITSKFSRAFNNSSSVKLRTKLNNVDSGPQMLNVVTSTGGSRQEK